MSVTISALFTFSLESFTASDATHIFFRIQSRTIITRNEIGCTCLSPRNSIHFVAQRPNQKIEWQSYKWCQKSNEEDTDDLQTETIGPGDNISDHSYDGNDPQKDKEDSNNIHP